MATRNKDLYKILQVDPSAEAEVIEAAYKRLALKYHPDTSRSPSATQRMQEINEAYEILSDAIKRAQYDGHRPVVEHRPLVRSDVTRRRIEREALVARQRADEEQARREEAEQEALVARRHAEEERQRREDAEWEADAVRRHAEQEHQWCQKAEQEAHSANERADRERQLREKANREAQAARQLAYQEQQRRQFAYGVVSILVIGVFVWIVLQVSLFRSQGAVALVDYTATPGRTAATTAIADITATPVRPIASDLILTLAPDVTMTLVRIPSGEFKMGSDPSLDHDAQPDEQPQQLVNEATFYIGRYEVTVAQYAAYARANNIPFVIAAGKENHPIVGVSWDDAMAFCHWLSQTSDDYIVRLPSEAEWEKATRGTDSRLYPWGNDWDARLLNSREGGVQDTTPVGLYSPAGDSIYSVADLAGNVWEWTSSLYRPYPYRSDDGREDDASRDARVIRGGSWANAQATVRSAYRGSALPDGRFNTIGFRVAIDGLSR